jgi:hypothetical protein
MSKEKTPVLSGAIPILEHLMTNWEGLVTCHPHLLPFINMGLEKLKETYDKMDQTHAYVIAMGMYITVTAKSCANLWISHQPDHQVLTYLQALGCRVRRAG